MWDLAVESDPSTLEWIRETHAAERDPKTMGNTVDPAASTIMENGESKDILPENVETKPIPSSANAAPLALQISQGCIYKDKTLHVNPAPLSLRESSPQAGNAPPRRMGTT